MQQIQNQIKVALLAIVRLLWILVKGIGQLLIKGVTYVYHHRVQIVQYRYTLTIVMALSVAWASYRTYNYFTEPSLADAADFASESDPGNQTGMADESYAILTSDKPAQQERANIQLVSSIYEWLGTPHRDGGTSKRGTDCSYFVQSVYEEAYGIELNRNSQRMYEEDVKTIPKENLREGDLVFFNIGGGGVSHVGIYLKNGMFAHASTSRGVIVESLSSPYFQKSFAGAGRVKAKSGSDQEGFN
jgi:cell wall-associated NlpC family hydrolase